MPLPIGVGMRYLQDSHQRFVRGGLQAFLRVKNFNEDNPPDGLTDFIEVGFAFAPTGGQDVGTTDILIDPPPEIQDISLHNIGILGGRLNLGSKTFIVSHTFVRNQLIALGMDPLAPGAGYAVWRDRDGKKAVGIVYDTRIYSIESVVHKEIGGETINWKLTCNFHENPQTI